jgi:hypothetical protein
MSSVIHPRVLTAEIVVSQYTNLLMEVIRSFHLERFSCAFSDEDAFQGMLFSLIKVSDTLGSSYLDRYDVERAAPTTYLRMYAVQWMTKLVRRLRREPNTKSLTHMDSGKAEPDVYDDLAVSDILRLLDRKPYNVARSLAPNGEPRSTLHIVQLMLVRRLKVCEVGRHLDINPNEVVRRLKRLRGEPDMLRLAASFGMTISP